MSESPDLAIFIVEFQDTCKNMFLKMGNRNYMHVKDVDYNRNSRLEMHSEQYLEGLKKVILPFGYILR